MLHWMFYSLFNRNVLTILIQWPDSSFLHLLLQFCSFFLFILFCLKFFVIELKKVFQWRCRCLWTLLVESNSWELLRNVRGGKEWWHGLHSGCACKCGCVCICGHGCVRASARASFKILWKIRSKKYWCLEKNILRDCSKTRNEQKLNLPGWMKHFLF